MMVMMIAMTPSLNASRRPLPMMSLALRLRAFTQKDVSGALARNVLLTVISERMRINVVPQMLTGTDQHGPQREMQLVNQAGAQILSNSFDATAKADIQTLRCGGR